MKRIINKANRKSIGASRMRYSNRKGSASIDYFLVLAIIIPLAAFMTWAVPRIIQLVYEFLITMVGVPFM